MNNIQELREQLEKLKKLDASNLAEYNALLASDKKDIREEEMELVHFGAKIQEEIKAIEAKIAEQEKEQEKEPTIEEVRAEVEQLERLCATNKEEYDALLASDKVDIVSEEKELVGYGAWLEKQLAEKKQQLAEMEALANAKQQ